MKKINLLITLVCQCFLLSSQVVLYNQGAITAKGEENNETSIYIYGGMQISGDDVQTSQIELENTRMKLSGDFINDVPSGLNGGNIFVQPASGKDGTFEFCANSLQQITTSGTNVSDIPSKLYNYIDFPHLEVNNNKHVVINPRLAVKTKDIVLTKGWLIVDSEIAQPLIDGDINVNNNQESVLAHLLVKGNINYNKDQWGNKDINDRGFIQVNLKIPNEVEHSEKSIIGFGSPFKEIRSDYFMFNTLLEPSPAGFLANPPIVNPYSMLQAGKGYVLGIDLKGTNEDYYTPLDEYESTDFNQRATGFYQFNRSAFSEYAPQNQLFGNNPMAEAYQSEELNTKNVVVPLSEGFNYLSNPFTTPLDIDKLLGNDEAQDTWNVQADDLSERPLLRNRVWILAPNSVAKLTSDSKYSRYTYNYQVAMRAGGTYIDNDNILGVTSIAPLQMFIVRAYPSANGTSITIPESERVMGTSRFLRSTASNNQRWDDFIIEIRDVLTRTSDRISFVLREKQEITDNKNYANVERLVSTSVNGNNGSRSGRSSSEDFEQSMASQIYTKDASGNPLSVQFLPIESTTHLPIYYTPSLKPQPIQILGLRLNTKNRVKRMWLEDKLLNVLIEITPDMLYQTHSNPTDITDRFVIHFQQPTGIESVPADAGNLIYAYYSNSTIIASGFAETDKGNTIELFDINGQKLDTKMVENEQIEIHREYIPGVYILKMRGSRNQLVKILVKK